LKTITSDNFYCQSQSARHQALSFPSPARMNSVTRTKRSAAIKALEKIKSIAKEAENYDDFGEEIEVESIDTTKDSINFIPKESNTTPTPPAEVKKSVEVSKEEPKKTPNTLWGIASGENELFKASTKYYNTLKSINVTNVKEYLDASEKNDKRYFIIPELMKYLIANPALMLHHEKFGTTVVNKMLEFEIHMVTSKKIGKYEVTEEYRREFLGLVKILKKIAGIYGKLKLNDSSFYDNITTIADSL
jgi:hypothetical protein